MPWKKNVAYKAYSIINVHSINQMTSKNLERWNNVIEKRVVILIIFKWAFNKSTIYVQTESATTKSICIIK